nr:MAG TPA: hypothetical protein [Caudoviricetes sp.]
MYATVLVAFFMLIFQKEGDPIISELSVKQQK